MYNSYVQNSTHSHKIPQIPSAQHSIRGSNLFFGASERDPTGLSCYSSVKYGMSSDWTFRMRTTVSNEIFMVPTLSGKIPV